MNIEVEDDFDEEFYEIVCPEVKGYYEGSQYSKRERYYHHYLNYGQSLYKNCQEAEDKLFGNIEVKNNFNEHLHEKNHPKVKDHMMWMGEWISKLSTRKRYYHYYLKYCLADNFTFINMDYLIPEKNDTGGEIDYFIVCHDQEIILKQISSGTFNSLYNYRFLFVGNRPTDRLYKYGSQIIICRDLDDNIEQYPYLCSFTAWYAVVKNQICKANHIVLLEYDTIIKSNLHSNNIQNNKVITYSKTLLNHYVFYKSTPWLEISLKEVYNIDLATFIQTYKNSYKYWPTTTNVALSRDILDSFVDWFLPMTDIFKDYPLGSYVHERAFFVFCVLNNIKITFQDSTLYHNQLRSHQTNDIYGQFLETKNTTIFHHSMIPEYDRLYSLHFEQCLKNKQDFSKTQIIIDGIDLLK